MPPYAPLDRPIPQPGILDIALYQGGASKIAGQRNVIKLSSNENPLGPSPKAIAAYQAASAELHRYPSTDHADLRAALGARYDLKPDQIICGAGSDEIIAFLCNALLASTDKKRSQCAHLLLESFFNQHRHDMSGDAAVFMTIVQHSCHSCAALADLLEIRAQQKSSSKYQAFVALSTKQPPGQQRKRKALRNARCQEKTWETHSRRALPWQAQSIRHETI